MCKVRKAESLAAPRHTSNCGHCGKVSESELTVITTITSSRTGIHNSLFSLLKLLRKCSLKNNLMVWKHNKTPASNLTLVYMSLLNHLILIAPSIPPRWNSHNRMTTTLWSAWLFPWGWHKLLNEVMYLSTQDNLIYVHPYQIGPQCWSSALCQYKLLPEVFPGCVVYVLAPRNFSVWALFPVGIFLFCSSIPLF